MVRQSAEIPVDLVARQFPACHKNERMLPCKQYSHGAYTCTRTGSGSASFLPLTATAMTSADVH